MAGASDAGSRHGPSVQLETLANLTAASTDIKLRPMPVENLPQLELAVPVSDGSRGHARRSLVLVEERVGHFQVLPKHENNESEEQRAAETEGQRKKEHARTSQRPSVLTNQPTGRVSQVTPSAALVKKKTCAPQNHGDSHHYLFIIIITGRQYKYSLPAQKVVKASLTRAEKNKTTTLTNSSMILFFV